MRRYEDLTKQEREEALKSFFAILEKIKGLNAVDGTKILVSELKSLDIEIVAEMNSDDEGIYSLDTVLCNEGYADEGDYIDPIFFSFVFDDSESFFDEEGCLTIPLEEIKGYWSLYTHNEQCIIEE